MADKEVADAKKAKKEARKLELASNRLNKKAAGAAKLAAEARAEADRQQGVAESALAVAAEREDQILGHAEKRAKAEKALRRAERAAQKRDQATQAAKKKLKARQTALTAIAEQQT